MAVPTNTLQTFQATNIAEDVSDVINMVSPFDTPFQSMVKKTKAENTYTEWLIDSLEAIDTNNANIEGDDATNDVSTTPSRVGNWTQLMDKTMVISTTEQAVKKYGVSDEWNRQTIKKGKALKNDMEATIFLNQARVVGAAGTAQKMRGLPAWYTTNDSRGVGGADGSTTTAATDGTQRNFTEALFKAVIVLCATNSNTMPSVVMCGIVNRANLSSQLSGNTTRFNDMMETTLNASITVYRSDYGNLKLVPNRRSRERDMHFLNPDYLAIRTLEPIQRVELSRTGLSRKGQIWTNFTLEVSNEAAHGILADLNTAIL
jgi:hypothetical protein